VAEAYKTAKIKGWWDIPSDHDGQHWEPNIGEKLMLVVTELAEAMEDLRGGVVLDKTYFDLDTKKPEGFPIELADTVIRIADLCGYLGIDLDKAVETKLKYN